MRRKHNISQGLISFVEAIEDPNFDPENLEEIEDEYALEDEPTVTPISNSEVVITPPETFDEEPESESGSAVTVVTPKGTSVSVTEKLGKAFARSSYYKPMFESAGSTVFFSNADINAFYNGDSVDEIMARRNSKDWNESQNIKNAFKGSVNEDVEEEPEDEFYGKDEDIEEISNELEDLEEPTEISAELSIDDNKIVLDNIELKDRVEEEPVYDHKDEEENNETKDSFVVGDPVEEALMEVKKIKDASLTGNKEDVMKSPLKVQTTNGVKDHHKVTNADDK